MPQGLKSAPRDFSMIVKHVLKLVRQRGIRCAFYIDDIIVLALTRADLNRDRDFLLDIMYRLLVH